MPSTLDWHRTWLAHLRRSKNWRKTSDSAIVDKNYEGSTNQSMLFPEPANKIIDVISGVRQQNGTDTRFP